MPHSSSQKLETRDRILKSARSLFNRRGFVEVTIDEIMADAGLTRGGFYKHFNTKEELYAEAIAQFACDEGGAWRSRIEPSAHGPALARMIVDAYLSDEHLGDWDGSCPMIGLPTDTARAGEAAKAAYRQVLEMMAGVFEANLQGDNGSAPREQALALVALCVGSMVLSRAVDDAALAGDLRNAARDHVIAVSGWHRTQM